MASGESVTKYLIHKVAKSLERAFQSFNLPISAEKRFGAVVLWGLFLLIAAVWAVFLVPPLWADRRFSVAWSRPVERRVSPRQTSTDLYQVPPENHSMQASRPPKELILLRRRRSLFSLGVFVLLTFLAIIAFGGTRFIILHLLADAALISYLLVLRRIKTRKASPIPVQGIGIRMEDDLYVPTVKVVQAR